MSITIGEALLWLRANDSKLKGDLDSAGAHAKSWVSNVGGAIRTGFTVAAGAALAAATGFGLIAGAAIEGNAQFESYNTRFSVLLGSMDAAKQRMAELAEFGKTTPFELPDVVEADTILQAFGFHSEESAEKFGASGEKIRRIAGDVASGSGAAFADISTLLGKFASGSTGEAIMRFQELGIITRERMAELGLEFSKSGELLSPLPEAMQVVLQEMDSKYGGMMDAQSRTFDGMMSNLQDWIGGTIRELGAPIFEGVKTQFGNLLTILSSENMQHALNALKGLLVDVFSGNPEDVIGGVANVVFFLAQAFGMSKEEATGLFNWIIGLRAGFDDLMAGLGNMGAAAGVAWGILGGVDFAPLINAIMQLIQVTGIQFPSAGDAANGAAGLIVAGAQGLTAFLNGFLIPVLTAVVNFIITNWPVISATTQTVFTTVQTIIQTVVSFVQALWSRFGDDVILIARTWTQNIALIVAAFQAAFNGDWRRFGELLREAWDNAWKTLSELAHKGVEKIKSLDWGKIGSDIARGLANGIAAGAQWIADAALNAAKAAFEAAKGFLGIKSPSTLFDFLGEMSMVGQARGIERNAHLPANAARLAALDSAAASVATFNTFNFSAQYRFQDERSLLDDVAMLTLARSGGAA